MLDTRVFMIIVSWTGVLLLAVGVGAGRRQGRGLGTWNVALALHTLGAILVALRNRAPLWLSATVANACIMASLALFAAAVWEFFDRRLSRAWVLGPAAFVLVVWTLLEDHYAARVGVAGALFSVASLVPAAGVFRFGRASRYAAQWLVVGGFGLYAAIYGARLSVAITRPETLGGHLTTTPVQNLIYVAMSLFVLPTSIGFLLMHRERAERESEERKREVERLNATLEQRVSEQVREIVARSREVERLNVELRQQVQDRSDELARVLARMTRAPDDQETLGEGARLGDRFVLESLLGEGGMGAVYRALDTATGERVAVKLIATHSAVELNAVYRFLREAHASAKVEHPAIVYARLVDVSEGRLFQVFELVDGAPLDRVLRAKRTLPAARVARFGAQLGDALAAAHAAGVVHRDIKPGNVMATRGSAGVRLLDFGISKVRDRMLHEGAVARTRGGALLGTPAYMAPEQVLDSAAVSGKSDVYAVGVILFEMLAGRLPFVGDTAMSLMGMRVVGDAPDLRTAAPDTPEALADIVQRCLARDPDARPTAEELTRALEAMAEALGDRRESLVDAEVDAPEPARLAARETPSMASTMGA